MTQGEIYRQVDGSTRYTWDTPRGTLAVDVERDGSMTCITTLGYRAPRARMLRDVREAIAATKSVCAAEFEAY